MQHHTPNPDSRRIHISLLVVALVAIVISTALLTFSATLFFLPKLGTQPAQEYRMTLCWEPVTPHWGWE